LPSPLSFPPALGKQLAKVRVRPPPNRPTLLRLSQLGPLPCVLDPFSPYPLAANLSLSLLFSNDSDDRHPRRNPLLTIRDEKPGFLSSHLPPLILHCEDLSLLRQEITLGFWFAVQTLFFFFFFFYDFKDPPPPRRPPNRPSVLHHPKSFPHFFPPPPAPLLLNLKSLLFPTIQLPFPDTHLPRKLPSWNRHALRKSFPPLLFRRRLVTSLGAPS